MNVLTNCGRYQFLRRVIPSFVIIALVIGASIAQDNVVCETSDIEQSVFNSFAEYHKSLGDDSVEKAVENMETLIESLREIVNGCSDGTELDASDVDGDYGEVSAQGADRWDDWPDMWREVPSLTESEGARIEINCGTLLAPLWYIEGDDGPHVSIFYQFINMERPLTVGQLVEWQDTLELCYSLFPDNEQLELTIAGYLDLLEDAKAREAGTVRSATTADILDSPTESVDGDEGGNNTEIDGTGEGTYADPVKEGWTISDGEGRWIGAVGYISIGSELCTRSGGYCKDIKPDNGFIAVWVYGKCDDTRRTRCEFSHYLEFELAGQRGIPYSAESIGSFADRIPEFPEDVLPGGVAEGFVLFQAPMVEGDFRFGWTPDYSSDTIWFGPLNDLAEQRETATTPETAPHQAFSESDSLNIRSGPGTNYGRVGSLNSGERVSVVGRNSSGTWIQIDNGWVSAQYLSWPPATDFMTLPVTSN